MVFQIEMTELQDDGKVKDTDVIFLTAYVYSQAEVSDITWTTVGTEDGMWIKRVSKVSFSLDT